MLPFATRLGRPGNHREHSYKHLSLVFPQGGLGGQNYYLTLNTSTRNKSLKGWVVKEHKRNDKPSTYVWTQRHARYFSKNASQVVGTQCCFVYPTYAPWPTDLPLCTLACSQYTRYKTYTQHSTKVYIWHEKFISPFDSKDCMVIASFESWGPSTVASTQMMLNKCLRN